MTSYLFVSSFLYGHSLPQGIFNAGEHQNLGITVDVPLAPCVELELSWHSQEGGEGGGGVRSSITISKIKQMTFSLLPNMEWIFNKNILNYFKLVKNQGSVLC